MNSLCWSPESFASTFVLSYGASCFLNLLFLEDSVSDDSPDATCSTIKQVVDESVRVQSKVTHNCGLSELLVSVIGVT